MALTIILRTVLALPVGIPGPHDTQNRHRYECVAGLGTLNSS